jgi:hypothetical protein
MRRNDFLDTSQCFAITFKWSTNRMIVFFTDGRTDRQTATDRRTDSQIVTTWLQEKRSAKWLVYCVTVWLTDWLTDWLTEWLTLFASFSHALFVIHIFSSSWCVHSVFLYPILISDLIKGITSVWCNNWTCLFIRTEFLWRGGYRGEWGARFCASFTSQVYSYTTGGPTPRFVTHLYTIIIFIYSNVSRTLVQNIDVLIYGKNSFKY